MEKQSELVSPCPTCGVNLDTLGIRGVATPLPEGWSLGWCFDCGDVTACSLAEIKAREGRVLCRRCPEGMRALAPVSIGALNIQLDPHNEAMKDEAGRITFEALEEHYTSEPDWLLPGYLVYARVLLMIRHWFGVGGSAHLEAQIWKEAMTSRGGISNVLIGIAHRVGLKGVV